LKSFLYLIQGSSINVIKYTNLNNTNSDVIVLTYDKELTQNEFPSIINIFLPKSTWAEGRNTQLDYAKKMTIKYEYYIFLDDDIEFIKGSFKDFQNKLLEFKPAIGIPLLDVIKNSYRYIHGIDIQHPISFDQAIQAFHKNVIDDGIVLPYVTDFDEISWWYSCEINTYLSFSKYIGKIMQFNDLHVENKGHNWDYENKKSLNNISNYKGGISTEGLTMIRSFISHNFQNNKNIVNSLFHDNRFPKLIFIDTRFFNFNNFFKFLFKLNFKKSYQIIKKLLRVNFNFYINYIFNYKNLINFRKINSIE
jgi:hypothetical protein